MSRSRKCGRESSSHWRAAASQLVTFTSWRAGILVGRQELLIWGLPCLLRWIKTRQAACRNLPKLDPKLDPQAFKHPTTPSAFGGAVNKKALSGR
jgi:hypothetical protein